MHRHSPRYLSTPGRLFVGLLLTTIFLASAEQAAQAESFADGKKYNPGLYFAYGGGTGFAPLDGKSHIQGVMKSYRWRDMEPSEGVYDFSEIQANLDQLASIGNKRLIISFQPTVFGPGAPTAPDYITSNPIYGDAGASGGYYGVYDRPSGGYHELLASEPVKARKKAFIDALAAEFDDHPLVEHIFGALMGETAYAAPPSPWAWSANVHANTWKEMVSYAANAFQETSVSTAVNFGQFDKSRYANWAADNGIIVTSPDMWLDYTNPGRGEPLWYEPEGAYAKQKQLANRVPTMSIASLGSWEEDWLYDGVNRRDPTAQDFIDFSQSSGIFDTHPDPNVLGRGTDASYLIGIGYNTDLRNQMDAAAAAWVNGGGSFAKVPDLMQSTGLVNSGFESPGGSSSPLSGWGSVPGWQTDSAARNSGVELAADFGREGADGDWLAYVGPNDPAVWNTTDHAIVAGSEYELTLALRRGVNNRTAIADVTLYYDDNGTRMPILTEAIPADDYFFWSDRSLSFDADDYPNAIGKNLGIEIDNTGSSTGFLRFDQVRLEQFTPGSGLPGDYDSDGTVSGADFLRLQRGFGSNYNANHFSAWKSAFGSSISLARASAVPEPSAILLALPAALAVLASYGRFAGSAES